MLKNFAQLIFPKICAVCDTNLANNEAVCLSCESQLPFTNFHLDPENPIMKKFYGRVPIVMATSLYIFKKGGSVQKLLHDFKYNGNKRIGEYAGAQLAKQIKLVEGFQSADLVIPVPLDIKRLRKRGYNQSEIIAKIIAKELEAQLVTDVLKKGVQKESQTRKNRFARWQNSETSFYGNNLQMLENKHVILIDDIITTGATLEACSRVFADVPGLKISIASLAFTQ